MLTFTHYALAQENPSVVVPSYKDKYSEFVTKLEAGETGINFREFRESFLESEQFKVTTSYNPDLKSLRKTLHKLMSESRYTEIIAISKKMLSIDYTDMEAHKILQQTYKILGDTENQSKYYDIEFGLLNSIIKNGDGKSCQTAWPTIQIAEEYFILNMVSAQLNKQSIDNIGGLCDKMETESTEGNKIYYFEISNTIKGHTKKDDN
jgi:hypothetical protein